MKYNTESFIRRAREIHGDKYDYSKVEYVDQKTKVCIICKTHGEFWLRPAHHINKGSNQRGCPKCGDIERRKNTRKDNKWFVEKAKQIHGDRYDYSKTEYVHSMSGVCITCQIHGDFWMPPHRHLQGHGCPKCGGKETLTTSSFIERAKMIHGDRYDYSESEYVAGGHSKIKIICPVHGEFWQYPHQHLQGRGCPHCRQSSLEKEIRDFLDSENIKYVAQKRAKWLGRQSLDFYLPGFDIAIECQGLQHFKSSEYFGGEERFKKTIELDRNKKKLCEERGISILYYSHYDYEYEFEVINDLITLKKKIYEFRNFSED